MITIYGNVHVGNTRLIGLMPLIKDIFMIVTFQQPVCANS